MTLHSQDSSPAGLLTPGLFTPGPFTSKTLHAPSPPPPPPFPSSPVPFISRTLYLQKPSPRIVPLGIPHPDYPSHPVPFTPKILHRQYPSPPVSFTPRTLHHQDPKLQALVYDILPSTTAVFSYSIGSRKLSANEHFFVGAQTVVSLLQTTEIKQGVLFTATNKVNTSTNKTTVV